ncbi:MAG: hypothetical protein WEC59_05615 [Salibacteraceae bacterium]
MEMSQQMPKKSHSQQQMIFKLLSIEVLSSQLCYPELKAIETKEFKFNIESNAGFDLEKNQVFVTIHIKVMDQYMKTLFGSIQTGMAYEIENMKGHMIEGDEGKTSLPIQMVEVLNSVSVSTTRGIMYSRFMGTYLGKAFLPIIDPKAMSANQSK